MQSRWLGFMLLAMGLLVGQAQAYPVSYALPLEKLSQEADLIVKVQALDTKPVTDAAFKDYLQQGFAVFATRLKVISVVKGDKKLTEITFHHYDKDPKGRGWEMFSPQVYSFTPGQSYLLFAKKSDKESMFRTFSYYHTMQEDQGLMRAANAEPLPKDSTAKSAVWHELTTLAASKVTEDVIYAIRHLDLMSNPLRFDGIKDFPRNEVLDVIAPMLADENSTIAEAALGTIGGLSPYYSRTGEISPFWLATIGKGKTLRRGMGLMSPDHSNPSAIYCRRSLLELANSKATADLRALAIRALGRSRQSDKDTELVTQLRDWSRDPETPVRGAAVALWVDYPSPEATETIRALADDKAPVVRASVASAIGCLQDAELLPILDRLLDDEDKEVWHSAAMGLLSFDPKVAGSVLKAHLDDDRYFVGFVNALGEDDPEAYRDELVKVITAKTPQQTTFNSQVPEYTAWEILMTYISRFNTEELRSGKLDKYLDALESPPNIGSGPYQTLYTYYHERGMKERMRSFRDKALKQVNYDLDVYFKRIDGRE